MTKEEADELVKICPICQNCGARLELVDLSHDSKMEYVPERMVGGILFPAGRILTPAVDEAKIVCRHCGFGF